MLRLIVGLCFGIAIYLFIVSFQWQTEREALHKNANRSTSKLHVLRLVSPSRGKTGSTAAVESRNETDPRVETKDTEHALSRRA